MALRQSSPRLLLKQVEQRGRILCPGGAGGWWCLPRGGGLPLADELVVLLGRSGSGKTSLLSLLGGLDKPDEGELTVAGHNLRTLNGVDLEGFLQTGVGWVFQAAGLLPLLTAEENVALPLRAMSRPTAQAMGLAAEALRLVGLLDRRRHLASELSGGEQQRVAIARAVVKEPLVLLADEPTSQLDTDTGSEILRLLREVADSGTSS